VGAVSRLPTFCSILDATLPARNLRTIIKSQIAQLTLHKNNMAIRTRIRNLTIQKKYLAFFIAVPIMLSTALIKLPCPVCEGKGLVSSTGMDGVEISDIQAEEYSTFLVGCDTYRVYQYNIVVTLVNSSEQDAGGYVSFILVSNTTGQILDTQYAIAEVQHQTTAQINFSTYFQIDVTLNMPESTRVAAKVLSGDIKDKACDGTGRVSLNTWQLINSLKTTFIEQQRVATPYEQPLWVETHG
jgi:hypothetical protein